MLIQIKILLNLMMNNLISIFAKIFKKIKFLTNKKNKKNIENELNLCKIVFKK